MGKGQTVVLDDEYGAQNVARHRDSINTESEAGRADTQLDEYRSVETEAVRRIVN